MLFGEFFRCVCSVVSVWLIFIVGVCLVMLFSVCGVFMVR